jgi:hypothetical protein
MDRSTFIEGMSADMHKWYWEAAEPFYKQYAPVYSQIANVKSLSEIEGAYYQTTSAIGIEKLHKRGENAPVVKVKLGEGHTIYVAIRSFDVMLETSFELNRDFVKIQNFLKNAIKANMPLAVEETKEQLLASVFNDGGLTAGADVFDNSVPEVNLNPSYGDLCYDGAPFFNLSDNLRENLVGDEFHNGIALPFSSDNLKTAHTRLTATNAKREIGTPFNNTQDLVLVVPTALSLDADEVLNSKLIAGNNNNNKNSLRGRYTPIENPWLTKATQWQIGRRGFGIEMFLPDGPDFDFWEDKDIKKFKASAHIDLAIGVTNWRGWVGSNFDTV